MECNLDKEILINCLGKWNFNLFGQFNVMNSSSIPLFALGIIIIGLWFTTFSLKPKLQAIGWFIATIGAGMNSIHCFNVGRIILGCCNLAVVIFDLGLAVARFNQYKKSLLSNREKFLKEVMDSRK